MSPSNFNAVVDGTVYKYVISFPNANLNANTLYALKYELQYEGEVIPNAELGQYIDLDTCNISTHYSQYTTSGARITTSVVFFPSPDMPLELGFNLSGTAFNAFYGNYLTDSREKITFSIRWLRTGDYRLRLSLWSMTDGNCHDNISFHGLYHIGASNANLGSEVLNNDIVTPKKLKDTTIYICYGEAFTRGDWTVAANHTSWDGTDQNGCDFINEHLVHFYTNDGICANNRLDSTQKVTLMRRPAFTATLNNGTDDNRVICTGTSAGYVYMTIGGTYASNSTYTVSSGQNTIAAGLAAGTAVKVGNLSVGTYNFTVTDGNQCSINVTGNVAITASANANSYTINTTKTDVLCNGASTGAIAVNSVTPGTNNQTATPYQYSWSNNETGASVSNLPAGNYTVVLTDNMGCTASKTITINQNPVITSTKDVECCASELPYHYPTQGQDTIFTDAGTKVVKFTSVQGCDSLVTVTLTVNPNPTVTISKDINDNSICANQETATLTATPDGGTGEIQYQWKNGENNAGTNSTYVASAAGSYNIIITDSKGCSATAAESITLTENTLPQISASTLDASICNGQQTADITSELTAGTAGTTGISYQWLNGENEISGATASNYVANAAGSYKIAVMDAQGCKGTSAAVTITVNTLPQITASTQDASICAGQQTAEITSVLTAGSNGATYAWLKENSVIVSATSDTYTADAAGSYEVAVVDAEGCKDTSDVVTITVNTLPTVAIATNKTDNSICAGQETINLTANVTKGTADFNGGYAWSNQESTQTVEVSSASTYHVTVTDAEGCTATADTNIIENTLPTVTISTQTPVVCNGDAATISSTVTGGTAGTTGMEYQWTKEGSDITSATSSSYDATDAGKYVVDVIDGNGCKSYSDTLVASVNPIPEVSVSHPDISCQNLGSATIAVTSAGDYTCNWNHTTTIPMATAGYSATNLTQGWYPYVITNTETQCALIDSVYIDNPGLITATVTPQVANNNETCEGSDYIVDIVITGGNPNYTLEWVNDGQVVDAFVSGRRDTIYSFSNLEDGDYTLTLMVTDLDGCTGSTNNDFNITIHPSYNIVRDINIATAQTTYTYAGQQYTVPAVPATYYGQTSHGCDSIISYALHQYDLDILIADTCTMIRSSYTKAYKNEPRTLYGDTIYVKTGETAEFFAYIANTDKTTWNDDTVDMSYEVLYSEVSIDDEDLPNIISALKFSTYYDRSGKYFGRDSVLSAMGEIPANTYAFRENNNSAIQHYDYFYFDAFRNVPNKVEFTPLENGSYTFKFSAEVRHSGNTGTNWVGIYNPYIVNRRYGHILGGYGDTPSSKDIIAARVFTVIASADGVAPTNAASSISEYSSNASVSTYPNPVRDQLNIRINGMEGETAITITDAQGKTLRVYNVNLDGSDAVMTYDMNGFAQGMYFINVRNNEKMISQKFILSK